MKKSAFVWMLSCFLCGAAAAQTAPATKDKDQDMSHMHGMEMSHQQGGPAVPVSYADLTKTAAMLEQARAATERYRDVRMAEGDGYHAIGPDVPGMGIHYVATKGPSGFDVEHPSILLYEKNATMPGGYEIVGVSYLFNAAEGPDGQPLDPPFPKALAQWHRHENLCVLADRSVRAHVTESECSAQGGSFTAESQWMVHAWIWKDSPSGVFAPTNPTVQ